MRKAERQGEENNSIASTWDQKNQVQLLSPCLAGKLSEEVHIMAIFNNFIAAMLEFEYVYAEVQ
jgi:hypothetical protein